MSLAITPLTPLIGAEARGVDLSSPVPDDVASRLWSAVVDHIVLVIRDQRLTPSSLLAGLRWCGEPMRGSYSQWNLASHPVIAEVVWEPLAMAAQWHTDHSNRRAPPKASALYAVAVPSAGGDTRWVNTREAYARLPRALKEQLRALRTINSFDQGVAVRRQDAAMYGEPVAHPIVRTHPETGARSLYFNPAKTKYIDGMSPADSRELMQRLVDFAIQPDLVYTHRWRVGDLVVFDNRSALHRSLDNYDPVEFRYLYRVLIEGEVPV